MPSESRVILVTGGAGYIGSHTCVELLAAGFGVVIVDNFINSHPLVVERIARIAKRDPQLERADVRDAPALRRIFGTHRIDAVIHFAGLKAVGESVANPVHYYDNNVAGSVTLLKAMSDAGCLRLVFSSSATVYGDAQTVPISEDCPIRPTNPYGSSKAMIERILFDLAAASGEWNIAALRYFNPVGAHPSGLLGEDPSGTPNNLMPYVSQVAVGQRAHLTVHGRDYPTRDGTGERDYVHVVDLARGHLAALAHLEEIKGAVPINLGTGRGTTVLELVSAFRAASGQAIPVQFGPRRAGDVATSYADPSRAAQVLGWKAQYGIEQMCSDSWHWQSENPTGYRGAT
jgi:UDP-glucose 4-epimerase